MSTKQIPNLEITKGANKHTINQQVDDFLEKINPSTSAYRGNNLIKRAGEQIAFTPWMVQEWIKCSEDPIYFIEKYVKIIHLDHGIVPFHLWDFQKDMVMTMWKERWTIIATARQVGKSTTTCAFVLWMILFHQHKHVAILADKGETAREILGRVKLAYSMVPKWMQSGIPEGGWNKGTILLENGSIVFAAATSSAAIRGYSINMLFLDEVAHVEGWDEFESAVLPTISSSKTAKVIMVSTPKGMNHFYKYWTLANKAKDDEHWNGYHPIHVNWDRVPGRDAKWYQDTLNTMSGNIDKFNQEFGVEFLGSSDTLIAGWKLKELVHQTPIHYDKGLSQYILPENGHQYLIVADTSHGKGQDHSAFSCIDISKMPYRIACVYRSNTTSPYDYADIMVKTALSYNRAWILAENNDVGQTVNTLLHETFVYDGILYSRSSGRNGKALSAGFNTGAEIGVRTTTILKIQGCAHLKLLIEQNQLIIDDLHTIEELSTFVKDGPSYKADKNVSGSKDDLVMGLVIFAWATDQAYFKELTDINAVANIRDQTDKETEEMLVPFGIHYDSAEEVEMEENMKDPKWFLEQWRELMPNYTRDYELTDDQIAMLKGCN